MSSPTHCEACGHALGIGRFCTNCGRPVPGRHPEAAPLLGMPGADPAGAPVVPPPAVSPPPAARYPLYAGDPAPGEPVAPAAVDADAGIIGGLGLASGAPDDAPRGAGVPTLVWVVAAAAVALIVALGAVLVLGGGDDDARADDPAATSGPSQQATDGSDDASEGASDDTDAPVSSPALPDARGTEGSAEAPDDVVDLTRTLEPAAEVPAVADSSRDTANRRVTFAAANMWDGDPRTSWRMPGDGTGSVVTIDLGVRSVVTEVGLINGYAKVDGPNDWYPSNRRIRAVQWEFDDGTRITQRFERDRRLQSMEVPPVETRRVLIRILEVSPPGKGSRGRDFTAISEVRLLGAPDDD